VAAAARRRLEGYHFPPQQIIDRFIVDFLLPPAELVVEVDGGIHLEQEEMIASAIIT